MVYAELKTALSPRVVNRYDSVSLWKFWEIGKINKLWRFMMKSEHVDYVGVSHFHKLMTLFYHLPLPSRVWFTAPCFQTVLRMVHLSKRPSVPSF
jgi:hypothetical protein